MSSRVAVYIDFDNVVISRYDQVHGASRDAWRKDNARDQAANALSENPVAVKLAEAMVDIGAVLDYAASFGTVALTRAYADWSVPANSAYRRQLVDRAVDLTQLFPVAGTKNGADIRLSVDAMEDLMQYADITHVVIVGGDSDYIALAQRSKQLGRVVIGIGVTGSSSRALIAACDEFSYYDALPGVAQVIPREGTKKPRKSSRTRKRVAADPTEEGAALEADETGQGENGLGENGLGENGQGETVEVDVLEAGASLPTKTTTRRTTSKRAASKTVESATVGRTTVQETEADAQQDATDLLVRALRIAQDRVDDDEWSYGGGVKSQMQRMDPGFKEKALGFKTFSEFVESRRDVVESRLDQENQLRLRLP